MTALIFVGAYAVIAVGRAPFLRLDRTGAALVGAISYASFPGGLGPLADRPGT